MAVPRALSAMLAVALACAGARPFPPPPQGTGDDSAREVLGRFVAALEAGRFDEAHALLSARWRTTSTPGRLAMDFRGAGPAAGEAASRVASRLAAQEPLERSPDGIRLLVGGGRAARLVVEAGGWRVDAIE